MRRSQVNTERDRAVAVLYQSGFTHRQVAALLSITPPSVTRALRRQSVTARRGRLASEECGPVGCGEDFPGSEYTADEAEYLRVVDAFRRRTDRKFPTATDYLRIVIQMGYRRVYPPEE